MKEREREWMAKYQNEKQQGLKSSRELEDLKNKIGSLMNAAFESGDSRIVELIEKHIS